MKKTVISLMGILTVLTLTFGVYTPVEKQAAITIVTQLADGNHGG